jgi:exodeoxyribonuclease VII small subunit
MAAKERKFEDDLNDLEAIVARIDSGELSLEESIGAFERGVTLVRGLNAKLEQFEKRVEVLMRDAQGELRSKTINDSGADKPGDDEDGPF